MKSVYLVEPRVICGLDNIPMTFSPTILWKKLIFINAAEGTSIQS
jgi:hypothetical protein